LQADCRLSAAADAPGSDGGSTRERVVSGASRDLARPDRLNPRAQKEPSGRPAPWPIRGSGRSWCAWRRRIPPPRSTRGGWRRLPSPSERRWAYHRLGCSRCPLPSFGSRRRSRRTSSRRSSATRNPGAICCASSGARRRRPEARPRSPRAPGRRRLSARADAFLARSRDPHPHGVRHLRRPLLASCLPGGLARPPGACASRGGVGGGVRFPLRWGARARARARRRASARELILRFGRTNARKTATRRSTLPRC
jgi:hypothetical protein